MREPAEQRAMRFPSLEIATPVRVVLKFLAVPQTKFANSILVGDCTYAIFKATFNPAFTSATKPSIQVVDPIAGF